MNILEIRFDHAPLLSQTVGPFLTERSAEDYKDALVKELVDAGWYALPAPSTIAMRPGDGFVARLRHRPSEKHVTLQVRRFDEPLRPDEAGRAVESAMHFLTKR